MLLTQLCLQASDDVCAPGALTGLDPEASVVLVFGAAEHFAEAARGGGFLPPLRQHCPDALFVGCSTAGEISGGAGRNTLISDDGLVLTSLKFDRVSTHAAHTHLAGMDDSRAAGARLGQALQPWAPDAVLLLGQGIQINGSALITGLQEVLDCGCRISGGLAGDGGAFRQTWVLGPHGVGDHDVVALGLKGEGLCFQQGSYGGWEAFGPLRRITRSAGNVLFELDGQPALALYRKYLGEYAQQLPASGLLFPFEMYGPNRGSTGVIRTILGIDEAQESLILAGEVTPDGYLQLMHASTDRLVDGAEAAARTTWRKMPEAAVAAGETLGLLVSCVGRKLVMGDRVEEEVEAVADVFGSQTMLTGFYSYGEISPSPQANCQLHNQTMTVTWIGEKPATY